MKPVAPRRRGRLLLLVLLAGSAPSSQASPTDTLRLVRDRLHHLEQQLFHTETRRQDTSAALRAADAAIQHNTLALARLAAKKKQADTDLADRQAQLALLQAHIEQSRHQLGEQLAGQYKAGQADPALLLLNQQDPSQASRQWVYYRYLSRARRQRIAALRQDLDEARRLAAAEAEKQQALAQIERRQAAQQHLLVAAQQHRRLLLARLTTQASGQKQQITDLQQDERRLARLIARLAHASPRPHATPQRREAPLPPPGNAPFAQLKGRLPLPVAGRIANHFGTPRVDTGVPWKGILILAAPGQPVTAVATGHIVYVGWLRGFGNLLIIDHGQGYMTLYGNNQLISRHTGELVHAGDTIALVGNSGNNKGPGVYYELRYQGKPLDPLGWSAAGH